MNSDTKRAVVIGSGVAGIAAAIRLSLKGFDVEVYEKNGFPGGKLTSLDLNGFNFDAGPSLFTEPENIYELFKDAGEQIDAYLSIRAVDKCCTYFFENGKIINAWKNQQEFASELESVAGEPSSNTLKYLQRSSGLFNGAGSVFINSSLHKAATWLRPGILKLLGATRLTYLTSSLNSYNKKSFASSEARQIFNRFATYNGSDPFRAPAMMSLIPHLEHNTGTWYPEGGMVSITNALYKLAVKKGVKFNFNTPVSAIIHNEGKVRGIVAYNRNIMADVVVSNSDVYFTYRNLLNHKQKADKINKIERSSSAIVFYWGIKKEFPQLGLHNIFFSKDYKKEFQHIFKLKKAAEDPTVYINITSRMEEGHAPAGKENWFVMVNMPANYGQDWESVKIATRKNIISKLNRMLGTDVEQLIETESVMDPVSLEQASGSYRGALYGTSSNSKLSAFVRSANFTRYIKGLYFCGGSVHPGGGIPLCLRSAKIAVELADRELKK